MKVGAGLAPLRPLTVFCALVLAVPVGFGLTLMISFFFLNLNCYL